MLNQKLAWIQILFHWVLWFLLPCFSLQAQESSSADNINIQVTSAPLSQVLTELSEKSNFQFSYSPKKIPLDQKISYEANKPLKEILDDLMLMTGLRYEYVEKQIVLKPIKKPKRKVDQTIHGYIKDKSNGEALIGAYVVIKEVGIGTVSNTYGFYSITLPSGNYEVAYSYIGFEEQVVTIDVDDDDIPHNVELTNASSLLDEVVITDKPRLLEEIYTGKVNLKPKIVKKMPALFGEADVVKSLELIPGIKSHSDGSIFYYVRGGNRDQNLILIDDAPIYNPSHMLGFFSTIIPDAVNNVDIYKGDMPASMGGRLSSVIDVQTKKGSTKSLQAWGNTSFVSTRLGMDGPIRTDKSSFLVSTRFSHMKWFFKQYSDDLKQLFFADFTGKLNFEIDDRNKLFFSTYFGGDSYFKGNDGIQWVNAAGTIRWNHIFNSRLFLNTTLSSSTYDYFLYIDVENNTKWKSHVANVNLKTDFSYFINPNVSLSFGVGLTGNNFNPGNLSSDDPNVVPPLVSIKNASEFNTYVDVDAKIGEKIGLRAGLRTSSWNNLGGAFEFQFDENYNVVDTLFFKKDEVYNTYDNLEPRLSIRYFVNDQSSIKMSMTRNVQNVHLISNSISPFTSLEVWLPSSLNIKPQIADQFSVGYYHFLPSAHMALSIEAYHKKMQQQIDYEAHAETLLNPLFERELRFGNATSRGIELLIKKEVGAFHGWIGYTYSSATRQFDEINEGKQYKAFYDRPHEINLVLNHNLDKRWKVAAIWTYYTGSPFSSPTAFFTYNGLQSPIYDEKNNDRLPDYHRLDLSATVKLNSNKTKKFSHELTLSLFNAYGRKNALFVNYNKTETADDGLKIPANLLNNNVVTSQTHLFGVIPSLSYSFRLQ